MSDKLLQRIVLAAFCVFAVCLMSATIPPPAGLEWVQKAFAVLSIPSALVVGVGAALMAHRLNRGA